MADQSFPPKWEDLKPEEQAKIEEGFPVVLNNLVRYDGGVLMPREFIPIAEKLHSFPLRDDDIWIITFPKAGTTWSQEMVWMLINDVDEDKGAVPLTLRSPYMEVGSLMGPDVDSIPFPPQLDQAMKDPLAYAETMTGRRVLKTHLPLQFLPPDLTKRCKVVYVARNPRDVCVSYFKMQSTEEGGFVGDFSLFASLFKAGLQLYGDYWHHVLSGWRLRDHPNLTFLWFEDMKKDQRSIIEDLCVFLDHPLTSSQVDKLVDHLKFDNMKNNPNANPHAGLDIQAEGTFFRKGEVGNWKNFFTAEKVEEWAGWIREETQGTGIHLQK